MKEEKGALRMIDELDQLNRVEVELPASAPAVRITAGAGSAGQKTWNLRRPVTLIGSKRPAHIILHANDVSNAHCVIVNTGTEVLLKDLHSSAGTFCNDDRVALTALKDGDVVTVGSYTMQIAIRVPENGKDDSGCGMEFVEPTKFPKPVCVNLEHTDETWDICDAVVLIGRHEFAKIRIDNDEIAPRQAILFLFGNAPAIFDLAGKRTTTLNGGACGITVLHPGDRVGIGPCTLAFNALGASMTDLENDVAAEYSRNASEVACKDEPTAAVPTNRESEPKPDRRPLEHVEEELAKLQKSISESWDCVNRWQEKLKEDAIKLDDTQSSLESRETELEAKDAALRGRLHDLTVYHEQLSEREQDLAKQLAQIQSERDNAGAAQADLIGREGDIAKRNDELKRREHVLAQRWARLLASTCPHCGKQVRPDNGEPAEPGAS